MRTIVNIDVPALPPAIEFYSRALGLRLERIIDGDVAELSGASSMVYLLANPDDSPTPAKNTRGYSRHWTPVHIDFVVDDIEQAAAQALAAGAVRESECVIWRGSQCITFSDPFGHGFCLLQFDEDSYSDDNSAPLHLHPQS
jgi:predicted enzyme related to lactoylglutathione lyase